jgi:hypothetical protein
MEQKQQKTDLKAQPTEVHTQTATKLAETWTARLRLGWEAQCSIRTGGLEMYRSHSEGPEHAGRGIDPTVWHSFFYKGGYVPNHLKSQKLRSRVLYSQEPEQI